jgi:DNA-binding MarR family transcriptional regulator
MAEFLDVSFSNATGIVDRMEERGLVERVRVPDDRRVVLVRIAPTGMHALEEIEALKQDRLQAILGHLDTPQLDRLAAALDDVRSAVLEEFGPDYLSGHDHLHPQTARRD